MRRLATAVCLLALFAFATQADASNGKVKIGILHDASGPYSQNQGPGDVASVKLVLEDFGKQVLGLDIVVVYADHQN